MVVKHNNNKIRADITRGLDGGRIRQQAEETNQEKYQRVKQRIKTRVAYKNNNGGSAGTHRVAILRKVREGESGI